MFQSTHPRGVRRNNLPGKAAMICFNPRTHVGCDGKFKIEQIKWFRFNPRTHVGCDARQPRRPQAAGVSIHAPTWGATTRVPRSRVAEEVSIHAPTWGATHIQQISEYHITKVHLIANNMQIFEYLHESYGYRYLFV